MKKSGKVAISTIIAAVAGYVTGILTAPKSGKETRDEIQKTALKTKKDLENKVKDLNSELTDLIDNAKSKVKSIEKDAKAEFQKVLDKAVVAKDRGRDVLSSVREGEVDNKDLQKAVDDIYSSIDNLKKSLKKNG